MRWAKAALAFLYIHLAASVAAPIAILSTASHGWNAPAAAIFLIYLLECAAAQLAGWACVGAAAAARRRHDLDALRYGWRALKLWSVPFYVLNFAVSFFVWFSIAAASRGILIILIPIPVAYTWAFIAQGGCVGLQWLRLMREEGEALPPVHSLLQFIPVLDAADAALLMRRYPDPCRARR